MNNSDNKLTAAEKQILRDFRSATGHSMADCKKTLIETNFDSKLANDILKKKYADKYALLASTEDVEAPEFVTKVFYDKDTGLYCYATIRSKSDVVTRSEKVRDLLIKAFELLKETDCDSEDGFEGLLKNDVFKSEYDGLLSHFREPIKLEKIKKKKLTKGELFSNYAHTVYHRDNGTKSYTVSKSSAPIVLKYEGDLTTEDMEKINSLAYAISMTIIGSNKAKVFSAEELDKKMLEDFKNKKIEEAKNAGKPDAAIEKIVGGQVTKFLKENLIIYLPLISTTSLPWLKSDDNGEVLVQDAITQTEKALKCNISVSFYKVLTEK
jgi:elongation factor Ts